MNPTRITMIALPLCLSLWAGCGEHPPEMAELEGATSALAEGAVDDSRQSLELVTETYPGSLEAAVSLHTQGLVAGQFDDDPYSAVDFIRQAQEAIPDDSLPPELMDRLRIRWQYDLSLFLAQQGECDKALAQFDAMSDLALDSILSPSTFVQGHMAAGDCANELGKPRTAADWYETALENIDESLVNIYGVPLELKLAKAISDTIGPEGGVTSLQSAWDSDDYLNDWLRGLLKLEQNKLLGLVGDVQGQITNSHLVLAANDDLMEANEGNDQLFLFLAPFSIRCLEELANYYSEIGEKDKAEAATIALKQMHIEIAEMIPAS